MKGKEILRLYKDSKQTNMYKAKKTQKNLKKNQPNKQRPFRFIQIYSLSRNTDIITFFVPQNQKSVIKNFYKVHVIFLKNKEKRDTRSHIKYKVNFLRFLFLISIGLSFHNKFVG